MHRFMYGFLLSIAVLGLASASFADPACPVISVTAPFTDSGTTCGQPNNCASFAGGEVVYEITIPSAGVWKFKIETNLNFVYYGTDCCLNDLNNSLFPEPEICHEIEAGIYYVTIEAYAESICRGYTITVEECSPCHIECPPEAGISADSLCDWHIVNDEVVPDTVNGDFVYNETDGTCHMYFDELGCDTVLCAYTGYIYYQSSGQHRTEDDIYHITIDENNPYFNLWLVSETGFSIGMDRFLGGDTCEYNNFEEVLDFRENLECDTLRIAQCLVPGDYFLYVRGDIGEYGALPCNTPYVLGVECLPECPPCPCGEGEGSHCFYYDEEDNVGEGPVDFEFNIPEQYSITDVNFCMSITELDFLSGFDDYMFSLISPSGTEVTLILTIELAGTAFICTRFDDEATAQLWNYAPPYAHDFVPDGNLSDFDGEDAYGTWTFRINSYHEGSLSTLHSFCIEFEYDEILPVELSSFDAIPGDGEVTLSWSTASELNNDHFEILRNDVHVANIAAHNEASGATYNWTDTAVENDHHYTYKLISVDVSGTREELATADAVPTAGAATVTEYALHQNYPNPFNPTTSINYDLVEAQYVTLKIYNPLGQTVATLVNGEIPAGRHSVEFDATSLSSGLYFYSLDAGDFHSVRKMVLMK